jgi:hypothetical protein
MDDRFNRSTLRNFFADGQRPSGRHFGCLIDSMLNMVDEGFSKTPQEGLKITSAVTQKTLLSFYRDNQQQRLWSVGFSEQADRLEFTHDAAPEPTIALDMRQGDDGTVESRVGINTGKPQHALQVDGVVCMQGRMGGLAVPGTPLADGEWHDVTGELTGCQAFELMAGAGREGGGRFALVHAVAMSAYNPAPSWLDRLSRRQPIRQQHAWYGKRCDRLELRWHGDGGRHGKYRLQIRTRCSYGEGVPLHVRLTQLWFDPTMQAGPR